VEDWREKFLQGGRERTAGWLWDEEALKDEQIKKLKQKDRGLGACSITRSYGRR
jgi:hypothetical protein